MPEKLGVVNLNGKHNEATGFRLAVNNGYIVGMIWILEQ